MENIIKKFLEARKKKPCNQKFLQKHFCSQKFLKKNPEVENPIGKKCWGSDKNFYAKNR